MGAVALPDRPDFIGIGILYVTTAFRHIVAMCDMHLMSYVGVEGRVG